MHPVQEAITGREDYGDVSAPVQVLREFYHACNSRDMEMMSQNWAPSDDVAMDNPLGGIKRGWSEIRAVYEGIFGGPAAVYVEFFDCTLHETGEVFDAVGRERGYLRAKGQEIALAIRTTRIVRKIGGRWRQIHHHGSIEDPRLLARYQAAVLGRPASLPADVERSPLPSTQGTPE
jgi:ketosteroid isomerase-like protein